MIERYHHYGPPRLSITEAGAFLIRDVLDVDGRFSGVCEYCVYGPHDDEITWHICREGVEFSEIRPFLKPEAIRK